MTNIENKWVKRTYWALIGTFTALYLSVAFVSTLHAITFFQLANSLGLAILLGAAYEIGQASVLFSILMTHNKQRFLAWAMMILLTTLQVTANVYASFKFMDIQGSSDWTYWQRAILFWLESDTPEMYKITIAWITGALLPIVALGMTALVADNIKLMRGDIDLEKYDEDEYEYEYEEEDGSDFVTDYQNKDIVRDSEKTTKIKDIKKEKGITLDEAISKAHEDEGFEELEEFGSIDLDSDLSVQKAKKYASEKNKKRIEAGETFEEDPTSLANSSYRDKLPANTPRGWHLKKEFIDEEGNVFHKGVYSHKTDPPKKA